MRGLENPRDTSDPLSGVGGGADLYPDPIAPLAGRVWDPGSQAPAPTSCACCSGWKGSSEKSPLKDTEPFQRSPTLGSASAGWGGGAGPAPHRPLPSLIHSQGDRGKLEGSWPQFGVSYFW